MMIRKVVGLILIALGVALAVFLAVAAWDLFSFWSRGYPPTGKTEYLLLAAVLTFFFLRWGLGLVRHRKVQQRDQM